MAKKKTSKKQKDPSDTRSFEQSLEELERIVSDLERGDLGLAEALSRYEEGVKHLKACHQLLEGAERKIELLSGMDANGNPITEPYHEEFSGTLTEKSAARGKRRSHTSGKRETGDCEDEDDVDGASRLF